MNTTYCISNKNVHPIQSELMQSHSTGPSPPLISPIYLFYFVSTTRKRINRYRGGFRVSSPRNVNGNTNFATSWTFFYAQGAFGALSHCIHASFQFAPKPFIYAGSSTALIRVTDRDLDVLLHCRSRALFNFAAGATFFRGPKRHRPGS